MPRWVVCAAFALWCGSAATNHAAENLYNETPSCDAADATAACGCNQCSPLESACDCGGDLPECCDFFNGRKRILGMLPSDHCFDSFISPISNPFYFEDPRSLTEVRGIFIDNSLPANVGNGDVQIWAAQFRGRITDRWSVIAPRLAYFQVNQSDTGAPSGFVSAPVGAKYNLVRDVPRQFLLTAGLTYFIPGSAQAQSNFGTGDFHLFLTGGKRIGNGHWISGSGFRLPTDTNWGTQMWYWSNQWDYELPGHIYPLIGLNWYHWMRSAGIQSGIPFTTLDILNLPANGIAGSNVVTSCIGAKWKPSGNIEIGGGWEFPVTQNGDVLRNRAYADLILRY